MDVNRERAWAVLTEYTKSPNLVKHGLAVEAAMRHFARRNGEDEETWGIAGLLHDFDYEQHPSLEEHPFVGGSILRERGWPEEIVRAVLSHGEHTGVRRESLMEKTLFAASRTFLKNVSIFPSHCSWRMSYARYMLVHEIRARPRFTQVDYRRLLSSL